MGFYRKVGVLVGIVLLLQGCAGGEVVTSPRVIVETSTGKYGFDVEVADDDQERAMGLMNRESLDLDKGMLFLFDQPQALSFWMKNVKFPIDIIFIDSNQKVLNVAVDVPPCEKEPCENYVSEGTAKYVLEVNSGIAEGMSLERGDIVEWRLK